MEISKTLDALGDALTKGSIRYTRDHGEPDPSPAVPYEVVYTIPQWAEIAKHLRVLGCNIAFEYSPCIPTLAEKCEQEHPSDFELKYPW